MEEVFSRMQNHLGKKDLLDIVQSLMKLVPEHKFAAVNEALLKADEDTSSFDEVQQVIYSKLNKRQKEVDEKSVTSSKQKEFDMSRYRQRHIALHIQYDGAKYFGFASQSGEYEETVEKHLFHALTKVKLIENRQNCNYSRCGRTDRGVSATGQIIALNLRSNFPLDMPDDLLPRDPETAVEYTKPISADQSNEEGELDNKRRKLNSPTTRLIKEVDYCSSLNRALPDDIRVLGWCEVSPEFSARFSSIHRTYRYFFIKRDLNLVAMENALSYIIGDHDFREIYSARIVHFAYQKSFIDADSASDVYYVEIKGVAFLWHMIRCLMSILFLVGENRESPDVFERMLDIETMPSKPDYRMASELPLVLHHCGYDRLNFMYQPFVLARLQVHYEARWEEFYLQACRIQNALQLIQGFQVRQKDVLDYAASIGADVSTVSVGNGDASDDEYISWADGLTLLRQQFQIENILHRNTIYKPLLERKRGDTYDERRKNLKGAKMERLQKHITLKANSTVSTSKFFGGKRSQGSL